jgi:predicted GNAT family acetyltransferase
MPAIEIRHERSERGGRWVATIAGRESEGEAELTWVRQGENVIRANHTYAPPSLRGSGLAPALVERMIADARAEGFKVNPTCPYIRDMFARRPEWADLLAR